VTQTATIGQIENAQNIVISKVRYTAESAAPNQHLIERFTLGKGEYQINVPKVGQVTFNALTDGVDMVDEADINMTYTALTTNEIGAKFVLTDKLIRQFNEDVFNMVGRQLGDGQARKVDKDIIALYAGFSTALGHATGTLGIQQAQACCVRAAADLYPAPISFVHHPNALGNLAKSAMAIGATYYAGILQGLSEELLRSFFKIQVNGVNFFWDSNIALIAGATSAYGSIFSKSAMAMVESKAPYTERERDASLRGWEVVMVHDYGVYEIDDAYGASARYVISALVTS